MKQEQINGDADILDRMLHVEQMLHTTLKALQQTGELKPQSSVKSSLIHSKKAWKKSDSEESDSEDSSIFAQHQKHALEEQKSIQEELEFIRKNRRQKRFLSDDIDPKSPIQIQEEKDEGYLSSPEFNVLEEDNFYWIASNEILKAELSKIASIIEIKNILPIENEAQSKVSSKININKAPGLPGAPLLPSKKLQQEEDGNYILEKKEIKIDIGNEAVYIPYDLIVNLYENYLIELIKIGELEAITKKAQVFYKKKFLLSKDNFYSNAREKRDDLWSVNKISFLLFSKSFEDKETSITHSDLCARNENDHKALTSFYENTGDLRDFLDYASKSIVVALQDKLTEFMDTSLIDSRLMINKHPEILEDISLCLELQKTLFEDYGIPYAKSSSYLNDILANPKYVNLKIPQKIEAAINIAETKYNQENKRRQSFKELPKQKKAREDSFLLDKLNIFNWFTSSWKGGTNQVLIGQKILLTISIKDSENFAEQLITYVSDNLEKEERKNLSKGNIAEKILFALNEAYDKKQQSLSSGKVKKKAKIKEGAQIRKFDEINK